MLGRERSGKTSLLRAILGLQPLTSGTVAVGGRPAAPRQPTHRLRAAAAAARPADPAARPRPRRPWAGRAPLGARLAAGGAGDARVDAAPGRGRRQPATPTCRSALLSGGEQQRVRDRAGARRPTRRCCCATSRCCRWTCASQRGGHRADRPAPPRARAPRCVFVTHEINPVLPYVDRVLYLADGRFRIGHASTRCMTSATLVRAVRRAGRGACAPAAGSWWPASRTTARRRPRSRPRTSPPEPDDRGAGRPIRGVWDADLQLHDYGELLALVHNSLIAGAVLGVVGGLISTFVMMRDLPFAVHGISELSFAGAAGRAAARRRTWSSARSTGSVLAAADHRRAGRPGPRPQLDHRRADAVRARPRRAVPRPSTRAERRTSSACSPARSSRSTPRSWAG